MPNIEFFIEDTKITIKQKRKTRKWLNDVSAKYGCQIEQLNFIYCSDNYLLKINRDYLDHDYYTDIITFDQREHKNLPIEADIFISVDRVKENANNRQGVWRQELQRVMVHGLLHLIGFNDQTETEKNEMRKSEDACLSLLQD